MDTTMIKNAIAAGELAPKASTTGLTSMQVSLPLEVRTGLAELARESGFSQQEIVRQAVEQMLVNKVLTTNERTHKADPAVKAAKEAEKAERIAARKAAQVASAQAKAEKAAANLAKAAQRASEAAAKAASLAG